MLIIKNMIKMIASSISLMLLKNTIAQKLIFNAIRLNTSGFGRFYIDENIRFMSYIFANRSRSRSQVLQDLWVCFELNEKRNGYFIEFGATDGLRNSNTWLLEKFFGWNGVLAEPNAIWHEKLRANRGVNIEHKCVSSRSNDVVTFIATNNSDPELSGIASFSTGDNFSKQRSEGVKLEVETISLIGLFEKFQCPEVIDYISIDTEGSELEIISKFDFEKYKFKLISIEQNNNTEKDIEKIMSDNGYKRVFRHFSQWDGWYVSEELRGGIAPEIFAPAA